MTKFGRRNDTDLIDLLVKTSLTALDHSGAYDAEIESVYVSSILAGELTHSVRFNEVKF